MQAAIRATQHTRPLPLVDPLTGAALPGNKYATPPTYSAPALALQNYLPTPTAALDPNNCGFVFYAIPYQLTDNQFTTRVDWTISPKNNLFGRYLVDGYQFPAYFSPNNILITTQSGNIERVQNFTLGDAYTITTNVVNSAHISILRRVDNRGYAPERHQRRDPRRQMSSSRSRMACSCLKASSPSAAAPTRWPTLTTTPPPSTTM